MGIKHGHVNEIVNATKQFFKRPLSAQRRHSNPPALNTNKVQPQLHSQTCFSENAISEIHRHNSLVSTKKQWKPRVFISYAWGKDKLHRDNQNRVLQLNNALRCTCKVETWIDTECMYGASLTQSMCRGIDNCDVFLVCITREYINKCNKESNDNCKLELNYAYERRGEQRILPIVMEGDCTQQNSWDGPIGAYLNKHIYVSCVDNSTMLSNIGTIIKHIEHMTTQPPKQSDESLQQETIVNHWICKTHASQETNDVSTQVIQNK